MAASASASASTSVPVPIPVPIPLLVPSLSLVEDNLYLGELTAATNRQVLAEHGVTHIVTVDVEPLPAEISECGHYDCRFVRAEDSVDADLLTLLPGAVRFIRTAVSTNGTVLVHCVFGVSRSATLVCAYLMAKDHLTSQEALDRVKEKRRIASPNSGFMAQLQLFYSMKWQLDPSNDQYRLYKLKNAAFKLKGTRNFENVAPVMAEDPAEISNQLAQNARVHYKCKHCRRILFTNHNMFKHALGENAHWVKPSMRLQEPGCPHGYFIEPMAWMEDPKTHLQGKVVCPKCKSKLGNYAWLGSKCICGAKAEPVFFINNDKVDESKHLMQEQKNSIITSQLCRPN